MEGGNGVFIHRDLRGDRYNKETMVLISDSYSEMGALVHFKIGKLICTRHLFRSTAVSN